MNDPEVDANIKLLFLKFSQAYIELDTLQAKVAELESIVTDLRAGLLLNTNELFLRLERLERKQVGGSNTIG